MLTLALLCLFFYQNGNAQDADTEFVVAEYMKVKPGMMDQYRDCEAAWKMVHQYRLDKGLITGWELEQVDYPNGTGTEYDFVVVTHFKNWEAMGDDGNWYEAAMKTLHADKRAIAEKAELYRDLVKREIWTGGDATFAPDAKRPLYRVENYMKIPANGWEDWIAMETKFVMPVHQKSIDMGNRAGWMMAFVVLPRGDAYDYQASTIDFYDSWADMGKNDAAAWEAIYPDMSGDYAGRRIESTRTLVKTEVRRLVDFVGAQ